MTENFVICPSCGAQHYNTNLIICPQCGAELHCFGENTDCVKKYNLITAYASMFKKFSDFRGRSRRSEFWYAYLANFIITFCLVLAMLILDYFAVRDAGSSGDFAPFYINTFKILNAVFNVYSIIVFVPQLALVVRRLHDIGISVFYAAFLFVPIIGSFAVMAIMAVDGVEGPNRYGPDPKGRENRVL